MKKIVLVLILFSCTSISRFEHNYCIDYDIEYIKQEIDYMYSHGYLDNKDIDDLIKILE